MVALAMALACCTRDAGDGQDPAGGSGDRAGTDAEPRVDEAVEEARPEPQPVGAGPSPPAPAVVGPAGTETSGALPLQPGVFVDTGSPCAIPANAGLRIYDGRGIRGSATHDCVAQVRSQRDKVYQVEQSCIDTPSGPGPRTSESQVITVHDRRGFTLASAGQSMRFRYCERDQLPEYLRQMQ
ncbi:MAG: hypothetical protein EOP92_40900 [Lysobacteraceae bacterium]|nr:MAG: hypothetical protein EOP92_40900 [Xanthomonadaceae bacterium]